MNLNGGHSVRLRRATDWQEMYCGANQMREYMEIERRFFVNGHGEKPWREGLGSTSIRQFYLRKDRLLLIDSALVYGGSVVVQLDAEQKTIFKSEQNWTVRVRYRNDRTIFTLKGKRQQASAREMEWVIERNVGEALVSTEDCPHVEKTRYEWRGSDGMLWEIDEFGGGLLGLVLAEVELQESGQPVEIPEWIGLELTGNHVWSNSNLAYRPSQLIRD